MSVGCTEVVWQVPDCPVPVQEIPNLDRYDEIVNGCPGQDEGEEV